MPTEINCTPEITAMKTNKKAYPWGRFGLVTLSAMVKIPRINPSPAKTNPKIVAIRKGNIEKLMNMFSQREASLDNV